MRARRSGPLTGLCTIACTCALLAGACGAPDSDDPEAMAPPPGDALVVEPPSGRDLQPVVLPDFSLMAEPVQGQMRSLHVALMSTIENLATNASELGSAYGEMGKLLMAATYFDAAEACYVCEHDRAAAGRGLTPVTTDLVSLRCLSIGSGGTHPDVVWPGGQ